MHLPLDVLFRLNEKFGLNWDKDRELLDQKIDELSDSSKTPMEFMKELIGLVDIEPTNVTGEGVEVVSVTDGDIDSIGRAVIE
ncbi:uncharacterized protein METZ01_LOCUS407825 [marine metagenome]|uniref:Uncharacterized protein n=1 Tax=marine metagenome TaxID=408172 RepID=A0A382W9Y2_9ZZZZ|tara:strand:+ start:167 stop:415 length:249 start_codon:yes stop_codon:yes gene_type:complete